MLLQTFSAGHCKAVIEQNIGKALEWHMQLCSSVLNVLLCLPIDNALSCTIASMYTSPHDLQYLPICCVGHSARELSSSTGPQTVDPIQETEANGSGSMMDNNGK